MANVAEDKEIEQGAELDQSTKAGRRNSNADQARLQEMHDHTTALGAYCQEHNCPAPDPGPDSSLPLRRGKAGVVNKPKTSKAVDVEGEEASDKAEALGVPLDVLVSAVRDAFWDLRDGLRQAAKPITAALYDYWEWDDDLCPRCEAVYDGYAIAQVGLAYYKVPYEVLATGIVLSEQVLWQQVTQDWVTKSADLMDLLKKNAHKREVGAVKSLGAGRLGNYLVVWGHEKQRDLYDEWFTSNTKGYTAIFDVIGKIPAMYQHAMDGVVKYTPVGVIDVMVPDEIGLWTETQLDLANQYAVAVQKLARKKALGSSSGALPGSRKVAPTGEILEWAIIEGSFTPTPAEPRMRELGVEEVKSIYAEAGLEFPESINLKNDTGTEEVRQSQEEIDAEAERIALLELELSI